jgi:hypothetical protein
MLQAADGERGHWAPLGIITFFSRTDGKLLAITFVSKDDGSPLGITFVSRADLISGEYWRLRSAGLLHHQHVWTCRVAWHRARTKPCPSFAKSTRSCKFLGGWPLKCGLRQQLINDASKLYRSRLCNLLIVHIMIYDSSTVAKNS